ncbi:MAG TPA: hypothetical protein VKR58_09710 [Aquella sp.]|nr:hypothetical protein [Aquella sp.]
MRLQITVDDYLGHELQNKAHDLGFSVSSYIRYLLKSSLTKTSNNLLDLAVDDVKKGKVEKLTLEKFKKQLKALK